MQFWLRRSHRIVEKKDQRTKWKVTRAKAEQSYGDKLHITNKKQTNIDRAATMCRMLG